MRYLIIAFLALAAQVGECQLRWEDNSALQSRFAHPITVHDNWLVGGYTAEISANGAGITMWNGSTYRFGASLNNGHAYGYEFLWSVKDVGLFSTSRNGSVRHLLKSVDGIADFTTVATGMRDFGTEALGRCFIDCGRMYVAGIEKRVLLYVEYSVATSPRMWYSAEAIDADAGNTWTDLFSATCPGIRHFHGGLFVPNKGLYIFTGDNSPTTQASILFASGTQYTVAHIVATESATVMNNVVAFSSTNALVGRVVSNLTDGSKGTITSNTSSTVTVAFLSGGLDNKFQQNDVCIVETEVSALINNPDTWHDTNWGLDAGTRDTWVANYHSMYVVGANDNKYRIVDMVTGDGKFGYWIPDNAPGVAGNSIWKLDMYDTTDSAGGTVTALMSGGVPGYGWYGCAGKNGIVYISTIGYANATGNGMEVGNDPNCHIYAIDPYTGKYADVKRIPRGDYIPSIGRYPTANSWFGFSRPLFEFGGEIWGELRFANSPKSLTGVSYAHSVSVCGHVDRQQQTQTNIITNPSFANGLTGWNIQANQITFQNGKSEIFIGDIVTGATSGAATMVSAITVSTGSWASGDAAGYIRTLSTNGVFDFAGNETLNVGSTECATLKGGFTFEIIDDPTGESGKVLRVHFEATDINTAYEAPLFEWSVTSLTTAQKNSLYNGFETFSMWFYIKGDESDSDLHTRLFLYPKSGAGLVTELTQASSASAVPASTQENVWHFMYVSDFVPNGATIFYHRIYPHYSKNDGKSGTIYFKDIQIVPGALPNNEIEKFNTADSSPSLFGGADINNDDAVDMLDLAILAEHWLE